MSPTLQLIVNALVRRDGQMLLVEEMQPGKAPAGATYAADRT